VNYLYIYPHPDDESFGPAGVMHYQQRMGHSVSLLTLTRGEATKKRHVLGVDKKEMGRIRSEEMAEVAKTLNLSDLTILDFPDSNLKEIDPRGLESAIADHIRTTNPHVIITYPVHGISGFHDHLITHSIVKRVFVELKEDSSLSLKRLAFIAYPEGHLPKDSIFNLSSSTEEEIDCRINIEQKDIAAHKAALDCYKTYQDTIERSGVKKTLRADNYFEIFAENFTPWLADLGDKLL